MKTETRESIEPALWRLIPFRKESATQPTWPLYVNVAQHLPSYSRDFEEYTPNSEGGRHVWKSFEHYRRSFVQPNNAGISERAILPSPRWYVGTIPDVLGQIGQSCFAPDLGKPFAGLVQHYVKRSDGGFVPAPSDLSVLVQDGLNSILPRVKSEMSLMNSIIELKDIRTIGRSLSRLKDVLRLVSDLKTRNPFRPAKVIGRAAADSYLQQEFNLKPLFSDIRNIKLAMSRVQRRLNDLVTRQGRVQSRHYVVYLNEEYASTFEDVVRSVGVAENGSPETYRCYASSYNLQSKFKVRRYNIPESTKFHMQIEYNYNYTQYQSENALMLAWLDYVGLNLNPAIVWNAIPWSFVIDWVVGVSRWLDQFQVRMMEPVINIRRCLWSVVRSRNIQLTAQAVAGAGYDQWPETPGGVVMERSYRRSVFMPTLSSIQLSGLTSKEVSLGAALVVTQRRRSFKLW